MNILHNVTFVDDQSIPQVYETPRRPMTSSRGDIMLRQTVERFYDHMGFDKENLDLNLDRFKVENEDGVNILSFMKNGRWFNLNKKTMENSS